MPNTFTEADGRQLAVDMLRELQQRWADQPDIGEDATASDLDPYLEGLLNRPPTIMRRYLAAARKGGRKLERGFLCVLSDYLGCAAGDGCVPDLDCYEAHDGRRHTEGPGDAANA